MELEAHLVAVLLAEYMAKVLQGLLVALVVVQGQGHIQVLEAVAEVPQF